MYRLDLIFGEFRVALMQASGLAVAFCAALVFGPIESRAADARLPAAQATGPLAVPNMAETDGWIITIDLDVAAAPSYPGDATRTTQVVPSFSIRRAGTPAGFSAPDDGVDFALYDAGWLNAGVVGKLVSARSSSGNPELRGLRFIDATIEGGVFAEIWPMEQLRTRAEIRQGLFGHEGLVASLGADWVEKSGAFTLSVGPRLNLGAATYMRSFFSVSPTEAVVNGRVKAFTAHGGISSIGALAAVAYEFSPAWSGTIYAGYDRLAGSAARSPVSRVLGSRNQFTLGTVISRSFLFKGL